MDCKWTLVWIGCISTKTLNIKRRDEAAVQRMERIGHKYNNKNS
jgi:hypothetical protein